MAMAATFDSRRPTTVARHSTTDSRLSSVERRPTVDCRLPNVVLRKGSATDSTFAVIKVSSGFVCDTGGLYYDWDGDGIPNWWEARFSRNGSKTGLDASTDDDADGMSNYGEFVAYTNPTNDNSKFTIAIVPVTEEQPTSDIRPSKMMAAGRRLSNVEEPANFALKWQSARGRIYSVYATPNLSEGWPETPTAEIVGTGDVLEYVPEQTAAVQFFKVSVRLVRENR